MANVTLANLVANAKLAKGVLNVKLANFVVNATLANGALNARVSRWLTYALTLLARVTSPSWATGNAHLCVNGYWESLHLAYKVLGGYAPPQGQKCWLKNSH